MKEDIKDIAFRAIIALAVAYGLTQVLKGIFKAEGIFSFLSLNKGNFKFNFPKPYDGSTKSGMTKDEINTIAEIQFDSMDRIGTDFESMKKSLQGLNGKALQEVAKSFGKRRYSIFEGTLLIGDMLNLFQWYKEELNEKELNQMTDIWLKSGLSF